MSWKSVGQTLVIVVLIFGLCLLYGYSEVQAIFAFVIATFSALIYTLIENENR